MARTTIRDKGREPMVLYPEIIQTGSRGNARKEPDFAHPFFVNVNCSTDRQTTAQIAGQVDSKLLKVIAPWGTPVGSWARVRFRGEWWDIRVPPVISDFTKATRHIEFQLRSRNEVVKAGDPGGAP